MHLSITPSSWITQRHALAQPLLPPRTSATTIPSTQLPGLAEFLSRVQLDIQAAGSDVPLTLPELEQQPTLLSVPQLLQAVELAGALTQREPSFAEAHATAVGCLLQLLQQRAVVQGEQWLPRHAITVLRAVDAIVANAGSTSHPVTRTRLLAAMQLAPSTSDCTAPLLERLLLPCLPTCTSRQLAAITTHLKRLELMPTPAMRDAQGARLSSLLAACVDVGGGDGDVAPSGSDALTALPRGTPASRAVAGEIAGARASRHGAAAAVSVAPHPPQQQGSVEGDLHIRDVLTVLASFSASGSAPPTLDHAALRASLPQLLCQAHGKAVADLLREIAVLKVVVSREQQVALGRAVNRHVQEMGAAAMSKVLSALSSCRGVATTVDMEALCAHLMTQLPYFTPRALALTLVNVASLGPPPRTLDVHAYTALISERAHRMRPAEICNVLKVLGTLRVPPTALDAETIGAALAPHLHVLPPRQLVPALTYFAALGSLPPSVDPAKLGTRVGAALPQLRVPGLVVLCWVVLRLRAPPQGLDTAALCAALAPTVPRMGSTEVATVAEALAMLSTLSKLPEPSNDAGVRQAVVHAANRVLPSAATPGEVVRTLRALRALRLAGQVRPSVVATAVSRAARAAGSAQELSRLLAMAARVPGVATRLDGGAVGAALQAHAGGADGHALARLLWVLTKMEQSPRGFDLPTCLRLLLPLAPSLAPHEATLSLWAIARLLQRGDVDVRRAWPCVQALCTAVSRRATSLNGDDLSMTLHAISMLPDVPAELDVAALGAATAAVLPTLRLRQLSQALATLAALPEQGALLDLAACEEAMADRLAQLDVPPLEGVRLEGVRCDVLRAGMHGAQGPCRCDDAGGTVVLARNAREDAPAAAVVECLAAFAAQRHQLRACTLARALPVIIQALPEHPLLAAHTLTALAKLRVALPLPVTTTLWDGMLTTLARLPATAPQWNDAAGALRTALWALCVMYASDAPSLVALMPRAQRAAWMLNAHPPTSSVAAKQLLLSRAVFLSLCGEECDSSEEVVAEYSGQSGQGEARGPQRPRLRCDSPAELLSEDLLRSCTMVWESGARTPVASTVLRQLAATAATLPTLTDVSQGQQFLEGGLLRGNLGCRVVSSGQQVVLCPTKPGRFVGGVLDGPMELRCALLRWQGVVPVVVPQREWDLLEDENQRAEYLDELVRDAIADV